MAMRIRARAIRRAGELLQELEPKKNQPVSAQAPGGPSRSGLAGSRHVG